MRRKGSKNKSKKSLQLNLNILSANITPEALEYIMETHNIQTYIDSNNFDKNNKEFDNIIKQDTCVNRYTELLKYIQQHNYIEVAFSITTLLILLGIISTDESNHHYLIGYDNLTEFAEKEIPRLINSTNKNTRHTIKCSFDKKRSYTLCLGSRINK